MNFLPSDSVHLMPDQGLTDSQMIQAAVNFAEKNRVSSVIIPALNPRTGKKLYEIDTAILLPSDITIYLENCHITLNDGVCDNIFRNRNMYSECYGKTASEQKNISIIGIGRSVLDGSGHNDVFEWSSSNVGSGNIAFNNLIIFHNVDGFEIRNIEVRNPRWWAMNFIFCSNGCISDISFSMDAMFPNQDGISMRYGCHHITIERISGNSGGDFISLGALGMRREYGYQQAVEGKSIDVCDITIRDVIGTSAHEGIVALRCHDESKMYNILIENVIESNYDNHNLMPYGTILLGQNYFYSKNVGEYASMYNVTIRNIYTKSGGTCITLGNTLTNSTIENINVSGSVNAITTTNYDHRDHGELVKRPYGKNGIKLNNVSVNGVHISGRLGGTPIDLTGMSEDDFIKNLEITNITDTENKDIICYCHNGKSTISTNLTDIDFMKKIDKYLESNFSEFISLDQIAQNFGIDKYRLCRLYNSQSGTTVMNALKRIRIDNAKQLLKTSTISIEKIAFMCGFDSSSYFSKIFRQETGSTPNEYRKLNRLKSF